MHLAIISDIHANLPALEATLDDIERVGVEGIWCLGDVVGYGADPDPCAELVAARCELCLVGNHDLAVLGLLDISSFSPAAAAAVRWTRKRASEATTSFLAGLEPADTSRDPALYHGSPRDPVWEYVLSPEQAAECIEVQKTRVSVVGHSHVALSFGPPGEAEAGGGAQVRGAYAGAGTRLELNHGRWLINPGSVGQPRDGDPRAAWLELDTEEWIATYHRVDYDIDRAVAAIDAAGLPGHLGHRLYIGQ
jgi:predicted phosphodiesterase